MTRKFAEAMLDVISASIAGLKSKVWKIKKDRKVLKDGKL